MRANCTSDKPVVKYREDEQLSTYSWFTLFFDKTISDFETPD